MKYLIFFILFLPVFTKGQIQSVLAKYPLDNPSKKNLNDGIKGKWKFWEDTNKNNFYEVLRGEPYATDKYHIKLWNRGGKNVSLESNFHLSKIGDALFINLPYLDEEGIKGYFFLKILDVNSDFTKMTATLVHDTKLWDLSQESLCERFSVNLNNPVYYQDTVHFYKIGN